MHDLFEFNDDSQKHRHIYTVSEITRDIKVILESSFDYIWIEGEISNFAKTEKGIFFFSLKDKACLLRCVMFNSYAAGVKFEIKDGMKVNCLGRIRLYERDGRYQLYVEKIEPQGIGSLQLALEQLKEKLEKEGFFSLERKKPIPFLPRRIGVVTSLSGAAIKDILKVLDRRFRGVHIVINPVQVQGSGAKDEIAKAIGDLNRFNEGVVSSKRIEVLIVGRGGGSSEDLWAFNEEIVARAVYNSSIPIISAVGHERDWSVADLVADMRAPTPSAAAELVVPCREDLDEKVVVLKGNLCNSFRDIVNGFQDDVDDMRMRLRLNMGHAYKLNMNNLLGSIKKLSLLNPKTRLEQCSLKIQDLMKQIHFRLRRQIELKNSKFIGMVEKLSSLSPLNILGRGYSITFKIPGKEIIRDPASVKIGDTISTMVNAGEIISEVKHIKKGSIKNF